MTQDEIIEMAKQAGLVTNSPYVMPYEHELRGYVSFAKLVAAAEREACANLMFDLDLCAHERKAADAIRARSGDTK